MYTRVRWKHPQRNCSSMLDAVAVLLVDIVNAERLELHKAVLDLSYRLCTQPTTQSVGFCTRVATGCLTGWSSCSSARAVFCVALCSIRGWGLCPFLRGLRCACFLGVGGDRERSA